VERIEAVRIPAATEDADAAESADTAGAADRAG
jgi:hypothetical protein